MENNLGLVKGKKNNEIYQVMENDVYKNLSNGKSGKLKIEDARKLFVIPIRLNLFAEKNPLLVDLISKLGLSVEVEK